MEHLGAQAEAAHLVEDLVGGLGPPERLAVLVVGLDVGVDGLAELGNAGVGATLERLLGEQSKEALHKVQPRRVGRGEVEGGAAIV